MVKKNKRIPPNETLLALGRQHTYRVDPSNSRRFLNLDYEKYQANLKSKFTQLTIQENVLIIIIQIVKMILNSNIIFIILSQEKR